MSNLLKKEKGFTLIEIVLVLAIAGLILVVVFLAVGGAQRSRRDSARVNNAGRVAAAIENYASNNNGTYPTAAMPATYFTNITDPSNGKLPAYGAATATLTNPMNYASGHVCSASGGSMTTAGAGTRNYAISYWSESAGSAACKDNK